MRSVSLDDAIDFAIELEENGIQFYAQCEDNANDDKVRGIFAFLRKEEEKHSSLLQRFKSTIQQNGEAQIDSSRVSTLMDSYARSFFAAEEENGEKEMANMSMIEAIDYGIHIESNSLNYYQKLKQIVPRKHRDKIDRIIKSEKKHRDKFTQLKAQIEGAKGN